MSVYISNDIMLPIHYIANGNLFFYHRNTRYAEQIFVKKKPRDNSHTAVILILFYITCS